MDPSSMPGPVALGGPVPTDQTPDLSQFAKQIAKTKDDNAAYIDAAKKLAPVKEQGDRLNGLDALHAAMLAGQPNQVDISPILGLIDSYTGSKMASSYQRPNTPQQTAAMASQLADTTQKGHEALLKDTLGEAKGLQADALQEQNKRQAAAEAGYSIDDQGNLTMDQNGMAQAKFNNMVSQGKEREAAGRRADAMAAYYTGGGAAGAGGGGKAAQYNDKQLAALQKDLDPNGARSGTFGDAAKKVDSAIRLQGLITDTGGVLKNLDSRQQEELAIGIQAMLAPGAGSAAQVEALVPHTIAGDSQKIKEWIMNEPTGLNQQAFVQQMAHTIDREKNINMQMIQDTRRARLASHMGLAKSNPEGYAAVLKGLRYGGLSPDGSPMGAPEAAAPGGAPAAGMPPPGLSFEQFKAWKAANAK
jgi:hypothetical protein